MSNNHGDSHQARVSPLTSISGLWLIPLITLVVGLWVVYDNWAHQGPLITIRFSSAEGLEEGKTRIKTRNIHVGDVVSLSLEKNLDAVLVTARMREETRDVLFDDSRFWVVQPQIGLSGVSGLGTLLSGQHIEFSPGSSGTTSRKFEGLDKPPITPPGTPGLHLTLNSTDNFSYGEGDPILYQGFKVGKIEDIFFNSSERMMYYNAFIEAPYHSLVTENTQFWDASGFRAELTATGFTLQTSGLEALILGGISFGLPAGEPPGQAVVERAYYLIYPSHSESQEHHYQQAIPYVLLVENSIVGLSVDAPVMLRGVQVGKVMRTGYIPEQGNLLDTTLRIPIHIEIHPGRLGLPDNPEGAQEATEHLELWLKQGMSASLRSGSLIFGRQLVVLTLPEDPMPSALEHYADVAVIPVAPAAGVDEVINRVNELLGKINQLEVAKIGSGVEALLTQTTGTMQSLQGLAGSGDSLLTDADNQQLVETLNETLLEFRALAENYGADSAADREITQLLKVMVDVLSELKPVLTELKNQPNSLIFTGRAAAEKEPQRKEQ